MEVAGSGGKETDILAGSDFARNDLDYHMIRASMVIIYFFFFGYQKWLINDEELSSI